jgi:hypothetical protein
LLLLLPDQGLLLTSASSKKSCAPAYLTVALLLNQSMCTHLCFIEEELRACLIFYVRVGGER